jgi:HSP20 family protein
MANIKVYNPFREMVAMQSALDKLFDQTWENWPEGRFNGNSLALDVDETDDNFVVTADLPGIEPDNINVTAHDDVLTITAEMPERTVEHESMKALVRERRYGQFSRSLRLPHSINAEGVEADFKDGTLTLTLPKAENAKVKTIPVRAGHNNN